MVLGVLRIHVSKKRSVAEEVGLEGNGPGNGNEDGPGQDVPDMINSTSGLVDGLLAEDSTGLKKTGQSNMANKLVGGGSQNGSGGPSSSKGRSSCSADEEMDVEREKGNRATVSASAGKWHQYFSHDPISWKEFIQPMESSGDAGALGKKRKGRGKGGKRRTGGDKGNEGSIDGVGKGAEGWEIGKKLGLVSSGSGDSMAKILGGNGVSRVRLGEEDKVAS